MELMTLEKLSVGKIASIISIDDSCICKLRLLDIGFSANTEIVPVWQSRKNKITAYLVKGTLFALRQNEAELINVIPV